MIKLIKSFTLIALTAICLTSCEDVPAPWDSPVNPDSGQNNVIPEEPQGDGTLENPFNVAGAIAYVEELGEDIESPQEVYVEGIVITNTTTDSDILSYGNMKFTIGDDVKSKEKFTAFQVLGPNKQKFTSVNQIKTGDQVVLCGKIYNYKGTTPETVSKGAAYVYSINGKTTMPDEGGEIETPVDAIEKTCAEAAEICKALDDNASSVETFSITGYITDVFATVSKGQQSFWMADTKDGGKVIQAYWANLPEGVASFTKGSKVKIVGKLLKYVNNSTGAVTAEVKNADVEILEAGSGDNDEPTIPGDATEITCAKAAELCAALEDKTESTDIYTVTGYITDTDGKISRDQQVFWMDDTKDGGKVFQAYWANIPDPTKALPVGTKVKMTGKLKRFGETAEMQNGTVVVLEMGEGGDKEDDKEDDNKGDDNTGSATLENGGFESWVSATEPTGWKSASTASSAKLAQSTTAHGGKYSVEVEGHETSNKRLASQEITLEAGTYTFSFYAMAKEAGKAQVRPGYVPVTDGKVGSYVYSDYATINNGDWTLVTYEFTLDAKTTLCLVVMNPKKSGYSDGKAALIDDATLIKK